MEERKNDIKAIGITIGKQMVAVNIIKAKMEPISMFRKGRIALLDDGDIMRITQLSEGDLQGLSKWTAVFEHSHISKDFADKFTENHQGEYNDEERAWIQVVVYKLLRLFLQENNQDESVYVDAMSGVRHDVIAIVKTAYDVEKVRRELESPLFLQKLHSDFLHYIVDLISQALHTLSWEVIKLMGDFEIEKNEIENLIRKYG